MFASISIFITYFLSFSVILICFVSKLPQIIRVTTTKSADGEKMSMILFPWIEWIKFLLSFVGISLFSLSLEVFRLVILLTYNFCYGSPILMYLEYPLVLVQQSILFYYVLKFKHLLDTDIVLLSMLIYLTMILFMADILPKTILEYLIVNVSKIWNIFVY